MSATAHELALAGLLIEVLDLDDLAPEDIIPDAPLFDASHPDSLGLDSIDALEISLAVAKTYKIQLKADDENNKAIFRSLRSLSEYIQQPRD
jgi:acyl carrier protein